MSDIAIKLENISMAYKLYKNPKDRMKEALHPTRKKYHKNFYALNNINLEIKKGEVLGIVGRNGSGKSTLLKIINEVLQPTTGKIQVIGKISAMIELGSGFNPEFSGMENIYFFGAVLGYTKKTMNCLIDEIVDFADIGEFIDQPLKTYSSGMKARLAFAVNVAVNPDILIVDEVLSVGDELFKRKCFAKMEDFFKGEKTVILVSHAVQNINQLCTRAILLDKGEQILEGSTKMVTTYYQKLIFAKKEDNHITRAEIIELNGNNEKKLEYVSNEKSKYLEMQKAQEAQKTVIQENLKQKEYFIPNFIPKSTVEYKNYDVKIFDACLKTISGKKVNHIYTGNKYFYSIKIKFGIEAKNISVGFRITTKEGMQISGFNLLKAKQTIEKILENEIILVEFSFICNLLPGVFFITNGVMGEINGENVFLNKIVDIFAFRVVDNELIQQSGIISLNQKAKVSNI